MTSKDDRTWRLPRRALEISLGEMARDGLQGNEGIAFWLGTCHGTVATVTHVVGVRGPGIAKEPSFLQISTGVFNAISDIALDLGILLLGQVHAHPGLFVDLSPTDRRFGISFPDYLSMVAPHYARRPNTSIEDCGVHLFVAGIGYIRLSAAEVQRRVIVDGGPASLLLVETNQ